MTRLLPFGGLAPRALVTLILVGLAGCAQERDPIDRVQPNAIEKSYFDGEWFYQRTVTETPASNGFTFVGRNDFGGMSRVTFDLQERWLFARRTTELIKHGDDKDELGDRYAGEVIAAFPVERHFDVVRAYNPTTGEQLNVVEENTTDRPWYERAYVRVDWSANHVHNYQLDWEAASVEPVPYYVQEIDPATGERHPDAPVFEDDGSYFDITNKVFAKAGQVEFPGYGMIPLCWLRGEEFTECGSGEYTVRNSFLKVDPENDYEALPYKGKETEVFGYFTTEQMVYDPQTGIREHGRERWLNRHNLWKRAKDENGQTIPHGLREIDPVVYHVNVDFPDYLKPVAREVAAQWNAVYVDVVRALGKEPEGDVFVLCENNPVQEGDPEVCGAPGTSPRIGDVRYSFMAYVPDYMTYGLLGLGPSNTDPETGEIVSGMAYVYHHNNLAAWNTLEMIELLNGTKGADTFVDGLDLTEWIDSINGPDRKVRTFGLEEAGHMVSRVANSPASRYWQNQRREITPADEEAQRAQGFRAWIEPALTTMYERGFANGSMHSAKGRLSNLKDTYIEELLLDREVLLAAGHRSGTPMTDEELRFASVARGGLGKAVQARQRMLEEFAAKRNMYLADMADDALMGLARELKDMPSDEAFELLRKTIYTAVLTHEVGHSLGLMHNFGGSDDALNYHDEYWHLRDDGDVGPRLVDPISEQEIDGQLYNYAYSSIMDYAGRYTIDGKGVGKYDRAALLFGYAGKVEVYRDVGNASPAWLRSWHESDGEVMNFFVGGPEAVHYTTFYDTMGDRVWDPDNRMLVDVSEISDDFSSARLDGRTYSRVPYIYCSHSRYNLGDSCLTRDAGADSAERMKNILDDLDTWYILRNFPRGVIGRDHYGYVNSYYGRVFDRLKKWHDIYGLYSELLPMYYTPDQVEGFLTDPVRGWGDKTWAVQNAFNYLVRTIFTPDVGPYGGPVARPDGSSMLEKYAQPTRTDLGITDARYYSTSWHEGARECGYTWWECLHHIGFYLDKIMAIEALSDSETNFVARSSPEDLREWEVSYYSTFPEQIGQLNSAILGRDFSRVGPYLQNGELQFPNYTSDLSQSHTNIVDPFATFSIQLYWQVLGQARFHDNFDQGFRDGSRVFVMGTGHAPDLGSDELVAFRDPTSGLRYGALRMGTGVAGAEALLNRANRLLAASSWCDDGTRTAWTEDDCTGADPAPEADHELLDSLELVKVLSDLSPLLTYGDAYNP